MALHPSTLPQSLLTSHHRDWINDAIVVLQNLQQHIDMAKRAGVPGMDQHQATHDDQLSQLMKFRNTYFPHG